jgi:hypothetical protein
MDRTDDFSDPELEWKLRAIAVPAAILIAVAFHATSLGHQVQRIWLTMMVHETGHAVTALLSGFPAAPTLWKTIVANDRSLLATALVALLVGAVMLRWWYDDRRLLAAIAAALLLVQLWWTFGLTRREAMALFTFGGDGGAMVLGAVLMATFFAARDTQLYRGALRWGFLVIGAAAFVDTFATWWTARTDPSVIPFGEIEGVGLSDPSKLKDVYGWSVDDIVDRYVTLGLVCAVVLAIVWAWQVSVARREAIAARRSRD